jgi:CRP/FNR family transcriptional regulator, cyclic AMP receptor protein
MAHEQVLADTEFFADAPAEMLTNIAAAGKVRELVRGDVLFEAGDDPDSLYVVLSGRIAIAIGNRPFDHRESVIALMDEGDLFGEMGMLDTRPRSAGARALEASSVLQIPYDAVRTQLDTSTHLLWNVIRMLSQRLRAMDQALADSVFLDVTGRTAKRLLELSAGSDEFTLPVTQEELAGMVGASRERVNKAIASFIKLKWLEQHDRTYHIIERAKLQQRAI